jgi:hypothetical protein
LVVEPLLFALLLVFDASSVYGDLALLNLLLPLLFALLGFSGSPLSCGACASCSSAPLPGTPLLFCAPPGSCTTKHCAACARCCATSACPATRCGAAELSSNIWWWGCGPGRVALTDKLLLTLPELPYGFASLPSCLRAFGSAALNGSQGDALRRVRPESFL